ncbi:TPA: tail fiber assembly protein [Escherichia coli]
MKTGAEAIRALATQLPAFRQKLSDGWYQVRIAGRDVSTSGFVAVFNSDKASWHLVEDHRGKTVYDVASGDALFISELGPLPENVTWLSPEGEFQKWNGTAWVKDAEAEKLFRIREAEETKNSLMQVASEHIAPLQDAVDLEIATEEETSLLEAWKKYRVLLNRVDTSTAQDIEWPALP